MKKKIISSILAGVFGIGLAACAAMGGSAGSSDTQPKTAAMKEKPVITAGYYDIERASVHDPSITKDMETGTYYVFGSHLATAKSDDLVNWTQIVADYKNTDNNPVYGKLKENFAESFQWAGYDDGDCKGGHFAVWAPDVHWFDAYEWEDGSKGAYLLYYSASSTWRRSCIGFAASKTIEGRMNMWIRSFIPELPRTVQRTAEATAIQNGTTII